MSVADHLAPDTVPKPVRHSKNDGRGRHLKLYMHPPSIPTKFQTIHYDDSEEKGFNSTSQRFSQRLDDLPGPGYYACAAEKVDRLFHDASTSKRGYGVGFASHSRRFIKPPTDLETTLPISPAQYNPRTPTYSYSVANSLSSSFRSPIAMEVRETQKAVGAAASPFVRTRWAPKPTPGPGEYSPHERAMASKWSTAEEAGAEFVFKSRTRRSELGAGGSIPGKDAPPPGSYDVIRAETVTLKATAGAQAAFKASARKPYNQHQARVPGPGAYEIEHRAEQAKPQLV
ncbi:O(6)-methylguanine-induced apoptosis 2 [Polyrhizophydium stewartii]|uniref:O(6)-methylguanine-induced apoptosis 2 n=1 Tax=Polyrhizophydium stewartii TaxID=2732419 RepID=A0ABR4NFP6_9FUNG